jgi:hypothetical protein
MTSPNSHHDQSPLVALVHKQLAALEALAIEGHAEAASLRNDIAALAGQLSATSARLARLEATLQSHAQMLAALRAGLVQPPAPPAQTIAASAPPAVAPPVTQPAPVAAAPASHVARPAPAPTPEPPRAVAAAPTQPVAAAPASPPASAPRPAAAPTGPQVQRGSRVRVVFDDDTTETYTIVRQEEANRQRNLIGENSPLGAALLGATVGDLRSFRVRPTGPDQMVEVLAIEG